MRGAVARSVAQQHQHVRTYTTHHARGTSTSGTFLLCVARFRRSCVCPRSWWAFRVWSLAARVLLCASQRFGCVSRAACWLRLRLRPRGVARESVLHHGLAPQGCASSLARAIHDCSLGMSSSPCSWIGCLLSGLRGVPVPPVCRRLFPRPRPAVESHCQGPVSKRHHRERTFPLQAMRMCEVPSLFWRAKRCPWTSGDCMRLWRRRDDTGVYVATYWWSCLTLATLTFVLERGLADVCGAQ